MNHIWQANFSDNPHLTGGLKVAMKPGSSNLQWELGLGMELPNKMNSQPLRGTHKQKKNARGRREGEGGWVGGGNKLNPVKLFFHSQWVWQRALTNTRKM